MYGFHCHQWGGWQALTTAHKLLTGHCWRSALAATKNVWIPLPPMGGMASADAAEQYFFYSTISHYVPMVVAVVAPVSGCTINGAVPEMDVDSTDSTASITTDGEECDCQCCKTPTHRYIRAYGNSLGSSGALSLQLRDRLHRKMGAVQHESSNSTTSQCERGATREAFTQQ